MGYTKQVFSNGQVLHAEDLNNITTEIESLQNNTETLEDKIEILEKFENIEGSGYFYMNHKPLASDLDEDENGFSRAQYSATVGYRNYGYNRGFAEGDSTKAGWRSHSEGYLTMAIGSNSHAEGGATVARGKGSHAEGFSTNSGATTAYLNTILTGEDLKTKTVIEITDIDGVFQKDDYFNIIVPVNGKNEYTDTKRILDYTAKANGIAEIEINSPFYDYNWDIELNPTSDNILYLQKFNITQATGVGSHAEGTGVLASGYYSHAEGNSTIAEGASSHAEGKSTIAKGVNSHAEGSRSVSDIRQKDAGQGAIGGSSHSEGYNTTADGDSSHAEGNNTVAYGGNSHAEGYVTKAEGSTSHAEGSETIASGQHSHSEGYRTRSIEEAAHAEGSETQATGKYSHAEGYKTIASGQGGHAEGYESKINASQASQGLHIEGYYNTIEDVNGASLYGTHVEGSRNIGNFSHQHVQGKWNQPDSTKVHIVGWGSEAQPKNIHTIDTKGNAEFAGDLTTNGGKRVPNVTVSTEAPTSATPGKIGDLWIVY